MVQTVIKKSNDEKSEERTAEEGEKKKSKVSLKDLVSLAPFL